MHDATVAAQLAERITLHWPEATCAPIDEDESSRGIRVHIADSLWLELLPPDVKNSPWTAEPVMVVDGVRTEMEAWQKYGIGVRDGWSVDDVADRFYEEIRFWWNEYEALASRPAGD